MRLIFTFLIFFICSHAFAQIIITDIDKYIDSCRISWQIPGMAVAVVKNDSVIFIKGYGVKEYNKPDKVDSKTVFGIASLTKAFTGAALAQLVDQNKITWDDKVNKHIPWFKMYDPWVTAEINIKDLLSHRSGLATFSGDLLWHSSTHTREDLIRRIQYLKPTFGFRDGYGYSNLLYLTAGEIVAKVSGISYDEYLKVNFFEPLNMTHTNTSISQNKNITNLAIPHIIYNNKTTVIKYISWDNIAPAGGINSNVEDVSKWIKMLLNKGKTDNKIFITEKNLNELWTPYSIQHISKLDNYLFPSTHFKTYGLGWDLFDYHGRKIINHSGGLDGMVSHICLVPEENLGFVILTNSSNYLPYALMYAMLDYYFDKPMTVDYSKTILDLINRRKTIEEEQLISDEKNRNKNSKPSLSLDKYCGTYSCKLYGDAEVFLIKDKLHLKFIPAPEFESTLEHWQYNTFTVEFKAFLSLPKGKVNFIIDNTGTVNKMEIELINPDFDFTELNFIRKVEYAH